MESKSFRSDLVVLRANLTTWTAGGRVLDRRNRIGVAFVTSKHLERTNLIVGDKRGGAGGVDEAITALVREGSFSIEWTLNGEDISRRYTWESLGGTILVGHGDSGSCWISSSTARSMVFALVLRVDTGWHVLDDQELRLVLVVR